MKCEFCEEFKQKYCPIIKSNRILYETDNFYIFPGLGQLVEGYLLITTKQHYIGIGSIPTEFFTELDNLLKKTRSILNTHYSVPLFFEHGPATSSNKGGCCIEHAHIHAMPVQVDLLTYLSEQFKPRKMHSFLELNKLYKKSMPYFFLETNSMERYVFEVSKSVPSQYMRKVIAEHIGKREQWDWAVYANIKELNDTIKKLRGKFKC